MVDYFTFKSGLNGKIGSFLNFFIIKFRVDFESGSKYENCEQKLNFYGFSHGLVPYYLQFLHLIPGLKSTRNLIKGLNVKIVNYMGLNHD